MSPHQRWLIFAASVVKSRRIASARAAAAGSGIVVFFHRLGARPATPAWRISRATRLRDCRRPWLRSSAWIRGAPYRPLDRLCSALMRGGVVRAQDPLPAGQGPLASGTDPAARLASPRAEGRTASSTGSAIRGS
jgi:hypothetical protein